MTNEELVQEIIKSVGDSSNIALVENCMTRLRLQLHRDDFLNIKALEAIPGVLSVLHSRPCYCEVVLGPGKCRQCADICRQLLSDGQTEATTETSSAEDWQTNKKIIKSQQKKYALLDMLKTFGEIFVPLIPGVVLAGLCAGMATLLAQTIPGCTEHPVWGVVYQLLMLINISFMGYLSAWAGYKAAERFGATPVLGGMLGMITHLGGINALAELIGLYDKAAPLNSLLRSGRGGVLAAVLGVWVLAKIEQAVRKRLPESLDIIFTPLLAMFLAVVPYVLIVMPLMGLLSTGLCRLVESICMSQYLAVRMLAGYIATVFFLPMVAMGMHHGLVALYTVQLNQLGYVTLYPALAMAGAGQVGAAAAIYLQAERLGNTRLLNVIRGALPAGILGVGEPLIYGVTLPLGLPFLTAGLGAGFGGAFLMAMQVASTTWGPSGVLAFFVMTAGPNSAAASMLYYGIGLLISYVMGFIFTRLFLPKDRLQAKPFQATDAEAAVSGANPLPNTPVSVEKVSGQIRQPLAGKVLPATAIPDATFAEECMGPCLGIEPTDGRVYAPFDGTVTMIFDTRHALALTSEDGLELLIHVGIDTVTLNGTPFTAHVQSDTPIKAGDLLLTCNLEAIRAAGLSTITPVVICNPDNFKVITKEPSSGILFSYS